MSAQAVESGSWDVVAARVRESGGERFQQGWDARSPHADLGQEFHWSPVLHFLDHLYRYIDHQGKKVYVSEPYGMTDEYFAHLAAPVFQKRWDVSIDAGGWWFPGSTLRIEFRRR